MYVDSLTSNLVLFPRTPIVGNNCALLTLRELREFLHYGVLLPRATLEYVVPLILFSKLLHSTIELREAKVLLEKVKHRSSPLLEVKHKLSVSPASLRLPHSNDECK